MPGGDIVDMDEIEAGIDKGRHAARRRFDDDAAGRRRANVARADRRRWIDDDGRQTCLGDHAFDQTFGQDLALLIGADRIGLIERRGLVRGAPSSGKRSVATLDV